MLGLKSLDPSSGHSTLVGTRERLKQSNVSDLVQQLVNFRKDYYKRKTKDGVDARRLELEEIAKENISSTSREERERESWRTHTIPFFKSS